jgi:zona occludens toxin (predicted ATPase)
MINIVVGKPGTGKTYYLVAKAVKCLNKGRNVYSNFFIDYEMLKAKGFLKKNCGSLTFWHTALDLINIKEGVILMDECQIYFNSRSWKDLPESLQYKFQQHRKQGLDIWGAVQNLKRVEIVLRELTNWVYDTKKVLGLFVIKQFDPDDISKSTRTNYGVRFSFFNKKLASCYDTFQEIAKS